MLLAMAVHAAAEPFAPAAALVAGLVGALLLFELLPAPRTLTRPRSRRSIEMIAADPRPIRVLSLPFGLRDGLSSRGNYSSSSQFYQTFHEKRLVGGYISRLPGESIERYRRNSTLQGAAAAERRDAGRARALRRGVAEADRKLHRLQIGYVVVDPRAAVSRARRVRPPRVRDDAGAEGGRRSSSIARRWRRR